MTNVEDLTEKIIAFRDARDWKQFHNPKDVALSLMLEAGEVVEHFQWKNPEEIDLYVKDHKVDIGDELADTLSYLLILAHDLGIDLVEASKRKLEQNEAKYPVAKAKGNHAKYTEL